MPRWVLLALLTLPLPAAAAEPDVWAAARDGDTARVKALLAAGVGVDAATRYGATPLYFAAANGHLELVDYLVGLGADPNVRDAFFMWTPLSAALRQGHGEVAVRLIRAGAEDVLFPPLVHGVELGLPAVVAAAVEQGPVYDFEKNAALALAREAGSEELAALVAKARVREELATVAVAPEKLRALAGRYRSPERSVEVFERDGGLWLRDGAEIRLAALSPHHFRSPDDYDLGVMLTGRLGLPERLRLVRGASAELFWRSDPEAGELVSAAPPAAPEAAGDIAPRGAPLNWPSFRGPDASGIGDGQGVPTTWDVASGRNVRWKREVPGLAHSSPVVWGERVFLTTAIATDGSAPPTDEPEDDSGVGDLVEHAWKVLALDTATGEVLWQQTAGVAVPLTDRHSLASHANSTPATDGARLVVVFRPSGCGATAFPGSSCGARSWGRSTPATTSTPAATGDSPPRRSSTRGR